MTAVQGELEQRLEDRATRLGWGAQAARSCAGAAWSRLESELDGLVDLLTGEVVPHLEADRVLRLTRPGPAGVGLERLQRQRQELGRLTEELGMLGHRLGRLRWGRTECQWLRRTLSRVAEQLEAHVEEDRELLQELLAVAPTPKEQAALIEKLQAAEAAAAGDLRFVWQAPIAATEAAVLRDNPAAKRVFIVRPDRPSGCEPHTFADREEDGTHLEGADRLP